MPAPHRHRLGQCKTSKPCECPGLVWLQPGPATGTVSGGCASTHSAFPSPAEADSTRCAAEPDRARLSPITAGPEILHLESAAGRAPREAVCFASSIPGQPWQWGEDGHTVLHLCSRTALQILLANVHFCRRE